MNNIIKANCLDAMKNISSNVVDCVITDPPYGINQCDWDILNNDWIKELDRLLKINSSIWVFCGWSNVLKVKNELEKYFKLQNWIIWDRIKGRGAKYNFVSTREDILWFTKSDKYTFNKQSSTIKKKTGGLGLKNGDEYRKLSNVWTDISPIVPWSKERVKHPTQKPVKLIERIVSISSNENDLILDLFAGSGTTGVACKNLNRNYILIEKEEEYCKIARDRLKLTNTKGTRVDV